MRSNNFLYILIFIIFLCFPGEIWAQSSIEVPDRITLANLTLKITPEYKDKIKASAENLLSNNKYFRMTVERADAYFPIVERILQEENVPDDMKYLVLQESKLVSDVVSGSNAVGYWQFKAETAREMGLKIDADMDERMNLVASTRAAARYLRRHNQYMNNWSYSILSYYAGLGGAKSIIKDENRGVSEMELDTTTHWYLTKFLAHKLSYESAIHRNSNPPLQIMEYPQCENKSLELIALETGIPVDEIKFYNKWTKSGTIPADKDYTVILPLKTTTPTAPGLLVLNKEVVNPEKNENLKPYEETRFFGLIKVKQETPAPKPVPVPQPDGSVVYEYKSELPLFFSWNGIKAIMARKGDNIAKLALQGDIDKDDFLAYNDMRVFDLVVAGQVYYIKPKKKKAKIPFHTVQAGQTLWEISQQYGISMKQLLKKNRMDKPEILGPGRVLWLRNTRPAHIAVEYKAVPVPAPVLPAQKNKNLPVIKPDTQLVASIDKAPIKGSISSQLPLDTTTLENDVDVSDSIAEVPSQPIDSLSKANDKEKASVNTKRNDMVAKGFSVTTLSAGETLYSLSKKLSISLDSLYEWNPNGVFKDMDVYYKVGATQKSTTIIPSPVNAIDSTTNSVKVVESKTVPTPPATPVPTPAENGFYTVQTGDTMYKISKQFNISVDALMELNGKKANALSVGERIKVK